MNHYLLLSVIFISSLSRTNAIKCYECSQVRTAQDGAKTRLCSHFDFSEAYIVDCEFSTMCEKRFSSVKITGQINVTSRGCAKQKYEYQKYNRAEQRWHGEVEVQEPYEEGCITIDNKGLKISYTEHCYCRRHLCNSTLNRNVFGGVYFVSVIAFTSIVFKSFLS
ncbi:uncharacterized protein [Onthophagus taurus]|uniref:uncharacterized protein n=1 Tax=Onthophagus taurus TaxID=166361 RepID=UPI000C20A301|nr:uncharacterized protein LOC111418193 [Onthophagus taurus]